jgi:hypothetical protein
MRSVTVLAFIDACLSSSHYSIKIKVVQKNVRPNGIGEIGESESQGNIHL